MKSPFRLAVPLGWSAVLLTILTLGAVNATAGDHKFEAQLIWGTNEQTSPNSKHKPVSDELRRKLAELPLRWTNYFEVCKQDFKVVKGEPSKVVLEKCTIQVKVLESKKVEVAWFDKKGDMVKQTRPLPKGEVLILAGNAPNATAWLVAVRRVE